MSRALQDQFIDDDEEETCPLCVEEFDLTDKGFRPCPCGYQICQFCYHNVKNNMNGLCPACRRPYNDADIEYKKFTPEETAAHKARIAQKAKKTAAALQKEASKREADTLTRKHLAGLRVVQKNLVYVTGLNPTSQEDQLLQTLRGDQYFGQYGKIIKIVVSKAKDPSHPQSVGVYVTYERKEDADSCINAVDGSKNGDRTLRAQFGTTKYCSAFLRHETCTNRNCMFLHEHGEENSSYSRADLSSLNAASTQQAQSTTRAPPQSQQPVASAAPSMARQASADSHPHSPTTDRPALPSTASWASKPSQLQASRNESRSTSGPIESPAPSLAEPSQPAIEPTVQGPIQAPTDSLQTEAHPAPGASRPQPPRKPRPASPLRELLKTFATSDFTFVFSSATLSEADLDVVNNYPSLFDESGGAKRRIRRQREEEERRRIEEQQQIALQQVQAMEPDENPELSGSLQLGGEPEERQELGHGQAQAIHPPQEGGLDQRFQFGNDIGSIDRVLSPQQQQQLLLQNFKTPGNQMLNTSSTVPPNLQQPANPPGHARNQSRYTFANDSASASAAVKPIANSKLMNQQSAMMPGMQSRNEFGQQQQFYTSTVSGPPPGLKTTGTPPVSGGGMFGQGHGFATGGLGYGANAVNRNANEEMYRELLRGRNAGPDAAKHDLDFPPLSTPTRTAAANSLDEPRRPTPPYPPGLEGLGQATISVQSQSETRRSTPTVPPGLSKPTALPDLEGGPASRPASRPSSRASFRRTASGITPALPLRPSTPVRAIKSEAKDDEAKAAAEQTPTKGIPSDAVSGLTADAKPSLKSVSEQGVVDSGAAPMAKPVDPETPKSDAAAVSSKAEPIGPKIGENVRDKSQNATTSTGAAVGPQVSAEKPQPSGDVLSEVASAGSMAVPSSTMSTGKQEAGKRKHPGKLDITAAVTKCDQAAAAASTSTSIDTGTPSRKDRVVSQTPSSISRPTSPGAYIDSPARRSAPRTLRVVQTPKVETPPVMPFSTPPLPTTFEKRLPSRQPSVASINPPGTPSSEHISDNISMTSTSLSRANSPPPPGGKVGSAPVRTKTKSQMKKERQERAKAIEEEKKAEDTEKTPIEEPAQEAIVSRKKKTRKEKAPSKKATTATNTPAPSRPASPGPKDKDIDEPAKTTQPPPARNEVKPPVATPTKAAPEPMRPLQSPHEPSPPPTPFLTAASLLAEIRSESPNIQKCIDTLCRPPEKSSAFYKATQNILPKDLANPASRNLDSKLNLDQREVEALLKGTVPAVHYGGGDNRIWDRGCITPSGAHLRALTQELEQRFLELERALRNAPEELRFRPQRVQGDVKFPSIDLESLKRGFENAGGRGVSVMEQMVQDGSTMKKGAFLVDEASKYINEFVMPPATPPPQAPSVRSALPSQIAGQAIAGAQQGVLEGAGAVPSVEAAERALNDARRAAEDKENALKRVVKRNRRLAGLSAG